MEILNLCRNIYKIGIEFITLTKTQILKLNLWKSKKILKLIRDVGTCPQLTLANIENWNGKTKYKNMSIDLEICELTTEAAEIEIGSQSMCDLDTK